MIPKADWSKSSLLNVYLPVGYYGWASPVKWRGSKSFTLKATTLDDESLKIPAIKLLKIDVEGSEYQVLVGAKETLKKTKHIVLEISEKSHEIKRILKEAIFKTWKLRFTTYMYAHRS